MSIQQSINQALGTAAIGTRLSPKALEKREIKQLDTAKEKTTAGLKEIAKKLREKPDEVTSSDLEVFDRSLEKLEKIEEQRFAVNPTYLEDYSTAIEVKKLREDYHKRQEEQKAREAQRQADEEAQAKADRELQWQKEEEYNLERQKKAQQKRERRAAAKKAAEEKVAQSFEFAKQFTAGTVPNYGLRKERNNGK